MTSLQPVQVEPLPMSSGGKSNKTQQELEKTNETLTMLSAQSSADAMYDPPVPRPVTQPTIREAFCGSDPHTLSEYLMIVALGLIVYGFLAK
jgi:hypothetical protein